MINLDERYLSYLDGSKKMRIDGIEEIQATLNGKVIFEKTSINQTDYQIPIPLKLQEGENQFSLVAYSNNQVRSYPQTLRLNYQIPKGPQTLQEWAAYIRGLLRQSKSWAVVIGVNSMAFAATSDLVHIRYALISHAFLVLAAHGLALLWALRVGLQATGSRFSRKPGPGGTRWWR